MKKGCTVLTFSPNFFLTETLKINGEKILFLFPIPSSHRDTFLERVRATSIDIEGYSSVTQTLARTQTENTQQRHQQNQ